jgi:pimeloyl-ACP methyl ester carboxylesterase
VGFFRFTRVRRRRHPGLVVHDWGGTGAPVLLAHLTGFHGRIWAPVAERLVGAGRRVYSFDFRGHGDSDAPPLDEENYSWHGFAEDALAVTRHLGLVGRADLLAAGHSKGGAALLLGEAGANGTYARIWTYEPIMFASDTPLPPDAEFGMANAARRRRNEWPSVATAYEAYASKPPLNVMTPESLHAYVDYGLRDRGDGTFELKCRPEVEAQSTQARTRRSALLPDVARRCVWSAVRRAPTSHRRSAPRVADRLPRARR